MWSPSNGVIEKLKDMFEDIEDEIEGIWF
jgi:hypothetical protein